MPPRPDSRHRSIALTLICLALGASACRQEDQPDRAATQLSLAIVNAKVWTGSTESPTAEAIGVSGNHIAMVGTSAEIRERADPSVIIDAGGQFVTPGFIDAHTHFVDGGFRLASVQLRDASTRQEFVHRITAFAATVPEGTWITGGDWDHTLWGGELPARDWIDEATPRHPVWVSRLDGHMALANTAALKAAGLGDHINDVAGGEVVRGPGGRVTGLLKDNAMDMVASKVPPPSDEMSDRALDAAMKYVAQQGVTSVHSMGSWEDLNVIGRAWRAQRLSTRIYAAVPLNTWDRLEKTVAARIYGDGGQGDGWLRIGLLKGFVDGSLGSHTAAFHEPFRDALTDRGLIVTPPDDLYRWISGADRAGLHVTVHAIGDRANQTILDIFERVERENGPRDRRFRIEHAQHLARPDIPRFAKLGIIASMQPYHAIDDGRWAEKVIGSRIATTYAFRSLLDEKSTLAFGSDWFVAPPTPIDGIYAAVTRRTLDGAHPDGWVPEQKITVEEALTAYTRAGAYASFEEGEKGVIAPGRLADLVIIDRDLRKVPPETIKDAHIVRTIIDGKTVYQR